MIDTYIDSEKAEQRWTDTETVRENKIDRVGVWKKDGKEERRPVITSESSADRQRGKHTHALGLGQCRGTTISHTDTVKDIAHTETDSDSDIIIVKK